MTSFASRRGFLATGTAGLALAPALAHAADMPAGTVVASNAPPSPSDAYIQGDADLQNRLTLSTTIDGKGPFRFVVDTGSDRSVISTELAATLGLINSEDVIVQGISRSLPAQSVFLKNVTFGHTSVASLEVPILPRQWLGADGYFGLDVIDGKEVTFDFVNHRVSLMPSRVLDRSTRVISSPFADDVVVRVNGSSGRLKAYNCFVDDVQTVAFIDSGAEISIGNTKLFAELQKNGAHYVKDIAVPVLGATGGVAVGHMTQISTLKIGTIGFRRSNLVIADLEVFDVWELADRPAMFVGMNFLQSLSALSIDYGRKELHFKFASLQYLAKA